MVTVVLIRAYYSPRLILKDADTGKVYARYDIEAGEKFSITFIHSVNQSPVTEIYEYKDGSIYQTGCKYYNFGAGVATEIEPGQTLTYGDDGSMIISDMNVELTDMIYVIGTIYDHVLEINSVQYSLSDLCGRNSSVCFICKGHFK